MFRKISNVLIAMMLLFALAILALVGIPLLQGNKLYAVLTESMAPTYPVGSIVIVEPVQPEDIQEQDVITYMLPSFNQMITHRVIQIDNQNQVFYTKGDNNNTSDPFPVPFEYLEGRVTNSYPYLGTLVSGMRTTGGIIIIAWIIVVFLLLIFLPDFFDKRKKENKNSTSDDTNVPAENIVRAQEINNINSDEIICNLPEPAPNYHYIQDSYSTQTIPSTVPRSTQPSTEKFIYKATHK